MTTRPEQNRSRSNLLAQTDYPRQFLNSLVVALSTVFLTMILAVMIAYGVTRQRIRGKQMIIAGMLYAYMFPPLLLAIPLYSMFTYIGLNDTLLSLVISHLTITMPLGVWFLWGFFKTMPFELEEAAMVEGCTRLGAFLRVVLPLSVPGLVTVAIFAFLLSWTDFTFALVMISSDGNKTVPLRLASMIGAFDLRWGDVMCCVLISKRHRTATPRSLLSCFPRLEPLPIAQPNSARLSRT